MLKKFGEVEKLEQMDQPNPMRRLLYCNLPYNIVTMYTIRKLSIVKTNDFDYMAYIFKNPYVSALVCRLRRKDSVLIRLEDETINT